MSDITVPFLDLGATYRELQAEFDASYRRVMSSGWFLLGGELERFEEALARSAGASVAVGLASGLDALILTLRAMDVGPGDGVIVPSNTFIATWLAVSAVGAAPVAVEPDPTTHLIGTDGVKPAVTARTAAIVPVHLYGLPVDMAPLVEFARAKGIRVLCDAAQAHGALYHAEPIGALGDASAWSFYPGKNLGAFADAGAVTTNDPDLARRLRRLRNYGSEEKYVFVEPGVNSRLDELQAAFLTVKLQALGDWNERRRTIALRYLEAFRESGLLLPVVPSDRLGSWHLFVVRTPSRDALQAHLADSGVQTIIHYPIPPHRQLAYAHPQTPWPELPIAERLASEVLSLPIGPHMSDEQVDRVVDAVCAFRAWPVGRRGRPSFGRLSTRGHTLSSDSLA